MTGFLLPQAFVFHLSETCPRLPRSSVQKSLCEAELIARWRGQCQPGWVVPSSTGGSWGGVSGL